MRALNFSKLSEKTVIMGYFKLIFGGLVSDLEGGVTLSVKRGYAKLSKITNCLQMRLKTISS